MIGNSLHRLSNIQKVNKNGEILVAAKNVMQYFLFNAN